MEKLLLSILELAEVLGVGESTAKKLVSSGAIVSVRIGDRRLIPAESAQEFVRALVKQQTPALAENGKNTHT